MGSAVEIATTPQEIIMNMWQSEALSIICILAIKSCCQWQRGWLRNTFFVELLVSNFYLSKGLAMTANKKHKERMQSPETRIKNIYEFLKDLRGEALEFQVY